MKEIIFAILLVTSTAFAGGTDVGNPTPWPWGEDEMAYSNSAQDIQAILSSQEVLLALRTGGKIVSISPQGDFWNIRTKLCSLKAEVTYKQEVNVSEVRVVESQCDHDPILP